MSNTFISDEDKKLFREAFKKLGSEPEKHQSAESASRPGASYQNIPLSDFIATPIDGDTTLSWVSSPLPTKQLQALRKGDIPFSRRIDLHGMTTDNARECLLSFLDASYNIEARCVLIIHGKGGMRNQYPKIKNLINRWLPQHPLVRAFHSAAPKHGGAGAVYVLLRKKE